MVRVWSPDAAPSPPRESAPALPDELATPVEEALGTVPVCLADVSSPWSESTRTLLIALPGSATTLVLQWATSGTPAARRGIAVRIRMGRALRLVAPSIPVPEIVAGNHRAARPFLVSIHVAGTPGRTMTGDAAAAVELGSAAGSVARSFAAVPIAGLRLDRTWAEAGSLAAVARRWLPRAIELLDTARAASLERVVSEIPAWFGEPRAGLAHGDLCPVNLVLEGATVVAVLDLERARIAHPLFDAAWWHWILRYHHPDVQEPAAAAFRAVAGIAEADLPILDQLAVIQCLEMAARAGVAPGARAEWGAKLSAALDRMAAGQTVPPRTEQRRSRRQARRSHVGNQFTIRSGAAEATVDPEDGGRLAGLSVDGVDILRTSGPRPTAWGSFAMAPWAGRLRDGVMNWQGRSCQFPTDAAPPHALHGLVVWRPWEVVERGDERGVLAIRLEEPWPFGGRVVQSFDLSGDRLRTTLRIEADGEPMPVIAGWHPWFVRRPTRADGSSAGGELELDLKANAMMEKGPDKLPTGRIVRPIPEGPWDDCFVEVEGDPVLRWPGFLEARIRSDAKFWVVYSEPADYVCVEPQSGPANGLNTGPFAVASPGSPFEIGMTIEWSRAG
jgi:aldose 1-epimerase